MGICDSYLTNDESAYTPYIAMHIKHNSPRSSNFFIGNHLDSITFTSKNVGKPDIDIKIALLRLVFIKMMRNSV